jgi:hypothetical protein
MEGAGVAFHAPPSKNLGTWMDGELYKVVLQRRLRMPIWPAACHCTACGAAMDMWGDHALSCGCKGDRTLRHNALRDVTYHAALAAGLQPQRETRSVFPARSASSHNGRSQAFCRSAQVKMPCARTSSPMDVGQLTSGSRDGTTEPQQRGISP